MHITDFRLHKVYENGLKSVKNKCNNMYTGEGKSPVVGDRVVVDWEGYTIGDYMYIYICVCI
jgi:hypothetical protein